MKKEVIKYKNGELVLDVQVSPEEETVWLTQKQMSMLFDVTSNNINMHIKNIIKTHELDTSTTKESLLVQKEGKKAM